jgi:FkbM family methyltransferase
MPGKLDLMGLFLQQTPYFRGKSRLIKYWSMRNSSGRRIARLPTGARVNVDLEIPYERSVWLQREEWHELNYLLWKLKDGDRFIDVGANIGLWSLTAATKQNFRSCEVISMEPNPHTFEKLQANIRLNNLQDRIQSFRVASSNTNAPTKMFCPPEHNLSRLASDFIDGDRYLEVVEAVKIDDIVGDKVVNGVKIDTEGHEFESLSGAFSTIKRSYPWIIAEFNTDVLGFNSIGKWNVFRFLSDLGYLAHVYDGPGQEEVVDENFTVRGYRNILFQLI